MTTPYEDRQPNPWATHQQAPQTWQPAPTPQYPAPVPPPATLPHGQHPVPYHHHHHHPQPVPPRPLKSIAVAYLLWFFLGGLGVHNFYLHRPVAGTIQLLLTVVGWTTAVMVVGFFLLFALGLWLFVEIFLIPTFARAANARMTGFTPY